LVTGKTVADRHRLADQRLSAVVAHLGGVDQRQAEVDAEPEPAISSSPRRSSLMFSALAERGNALS
jgi:hypothetical protein